MEEALTRFMVRIGDKLIQLTHSRMRFIWLAMSIVTIPLHDKMNNVRGGQEVQHNVKMLRSASAYLNVHVGDMTPKLLVALYQVYDANQARPKGLRNVLILLLGALTSGGGIR